MRSSPVCAALAALALLAPAARAAVDGPITRLATVGGRPDVIARADGSAVAVWEEKPTAATANVHFCKLAAGAGTCTGGSEKTLASVAGSTTSRPFLFDLSGGKLIVVHGGCCPQHTYRWISTDGGTTIPTPGSDFASIVPFDQGAAVGPGDSISLLGDPAAGTVGYQLANPTAAKTTQEAVLDTATGLTFAQAVSVDPASGRPFAAWASSSDGFFSGATAATNLNVTATWTAPPGKLAGATGMRLAGTAAVWAHAGQHEVARWTGSGFSAGEPLPHAVADTGEADIARDPAGGLHVVFSPAGTGAICYAVAADGTAFATPQLLGRDTAGVAGLQVSATGPGQGRVVFSAAGSGGPVSTLSLAAPALTPNVCGLAPTGLALVKTLTGSTLRLAVDPAGQDTTFHVEYGISTAYGASTADTAAPAAAGPVVATVDIGPLTAGTTYHARVVASNATGTSAGPDLAFAVPGVLAAIRARDLIRFPARCRSRRVRVALPASAGVERTLAVLRGTGRAKPLRIGAKRLAAGHVVLGGLARSMVRVRVALRLADGRVVRASRRYARCGG